MQASVELFCLEHVCPTCAAKFGFFCCSPFLFLLFSFSLNSLHNHFFKEMALYSAHIVTLIHQKSRLYLKSKRLKKKKKHHWKLSSSKPKSTLLSLKTNLVKFNCYLCILCLNKQLKEIAQIVSFTLHFDFSISYPFFQLNHHSLSPPNSLNGKHGTREKV